jgi:hypothetical protein
MEVYDGAETREGITFCLVWKTYATQSSSPARMGRVATNAPRPLTRGASNCELWEEKRLEGHQQLDRNAKKKGGKRNELRHKKKKNDLAGYG